MDTILVTYKITIYSLAGLAALAIIQLLVADVIGIISKHVPGTPIVPDHSDRHFRASRAVANLNESVAVFILLVIFCIFSGASPAYTAIGAWGYVTARTVYAALYYLNLQTLRSITFGLSLVFLLSLLMTGLLR